MALLTLCLVPAESILEVMPLLLGAPAVLGVAPPYCDEAALPLFTLSLTISPKYFFFACDSTASF